jgi:hypothetical protein
MSCLGVHFSIDEEIVNKLKSFSNDEERLDFLQSELEEDYLENYPNWTVETDKAWDAIHRTLTDGKLGWENGEYPLNYFILGGELLYTNDDYIMSLKTPEQVKDVAKAIASINQTIFREKYYKMDSKDYGFSLENDDFEYTWENFDNARKFWYRALEENRYILFTADQ